MPLCLCSLNIHGKLCILVYFMPGIISPLGNSKLLELRARIYFSAQAIISSKWFHNFLYSLFVICYERYYEVVSSLWVLSCRKNHLHTAVLITMGNGNFLLETSSTSPVRYLALISASNKEDFGWKYVHTLRLFSELSTYYADPGEKED